MLKVYGKKAYVFNRLYTFIGDKTDVRKLSAHRSISDNVNNEEGFPIWLWTEVNQPWENKANEKEYHEKLRKYKQMYEFIYEW